MVYNIHFSFNARKLNVSKTQNLLIDIANQYDASNYYFLFEDVNIKNNMLIICVFNVVFDECSIKNMLRCTKDIRNISKIYLDCIFEDNNKYKLIYASKQYLLSMEKNSLVNYNNFHRDRSYSETDVMILNFINKKKNDINAPFSYEEYLSRIS